MHVADFVTGVVEDSLSRKETAGVSLNVTLAFLSKSLLESHEVLWTANPITAVYPEPLMIVVFA